VSGLVKKVTGAAGSLFGQVRKHAKAKNARPPLVMPDEDELQRQARRRHASLAARGGRRSTILDDDETL
jgi:hypothetical protein